MLPPRALALLATSGIAAFASGQGASPVGEVGKVANVAFVAAQASSTRNVPLPTTPPPPSTSTPPPPAPAAPAAPDAAPAATPLAASARFPFSPPKGSLGYDISWPQCKKPFPTGQASFAIIGVTDGHSYDGNPCLARQWRWAKTTGNAAVYVNVDAPRGRQGMTGPRGACAAGDLQCRGYNHGWNAVQFALKHAEAQGAGDAHVWWLDVETLGGRWHTVGHTGAQHVISGQLDRLRAAGKDIGVYSTPYQWNVITGGMVTRLPAWTAGAPASNVRAYCRPGKAFGGGPVAMAQAVVRDPNGHEYDRNAAC